MLIKTSLEARKPQGIERARMLYSNSDQTRRGLKMLKFTPYSILNKKVILTPSILSGF
jgi:hypothetical protein